MSANDKQIGGNHFKSSIQHWDFAAANDFDYFQGQITKYITRWKKKNGLEDLKKALHFLEKYIELQCEEPTSSYTNQDKLDCDCNAAGGELHSMDCASRGFHTSKELYK